MSGRLSLGQNGFSQRRLGPSALAETVGSVSSTEAVSFWWAERRAGLRSRYRPQFHTLPIGVWVQHGPKPPPFQRPR
jgi:hypothetical protein